jgi:hypothetical protein
VAPVICQINPLYILTYNVFKSSFNFFPPHTHNFVDKKYLESFEMWSWREMEKIIWNDCVKNEEVFHRVREEGYILQTIKGHGRLTESVTSCV